MKTELTKQMANNILETIAVAETAENAENFVDDAEMYKLLAIADYEYVDEFVEYVRDKTTDENPCDYDFDFSPALNSSDKYERIVAKRRREHK